VCAVRAVCGCGVRGVQRERIRTVGAWKNTPVELKAAKFSVGLITALDAALLKLGNNTSPIDDDHSD
jgi:hypothetical protein